MQLYRKKTLIINTFNTSVEYPTVQHIQMPQFLKSDGLVLEWKVREGKTTPQHFFKKLQHPLFSHYSGLLNNTT